MGGSATAAGKTLNTGGSSTAQLALVRRVDQQWPEEEEEESREIGSGVTAWSFVEQKEEGEDICPRRQKDIRSPLSALLITAAAAAPSS